MSTDTQQHLDAEIAAIKAAIDLAARNRGRAEQARDLATAHASTLRAQLKDEFGVDTLAQAEQLATDLTAQLTTVITDLRRQIAEAGGH